jgi:hypothetical protein
LTATDSIWCSSLQSLGWKISASRSCKHIGYHDAGQKQQSEHQQFSLDGGQGIRSIPIRRTRIIKLYYDSLAACRLGSDSYRFIMQILSLAVIKPFSQFQFEASSCHSFCRWLFQWEPINISAAD